VCVVWCVCVTVVCVCDLMGSVFDCGVCVRAWLLNE
jgi:hypothetical protein